MSMTREWTNEKKQISNREPNRNGSKDIVHKQTWHAWRRVGEGGVQPPGQRGGVGDGGNRNQLGNIRLSVDPGKTLPVVISRLQFMDIVDVRILMIDMMMLYCTSNCCFAQLPLAMPGKIKA